MTQPQPNQEDIQQMADQIKNALDGLILYDDQSGEEVHCEVISPEQLWALLETIKDEK